MTEHEAGSDATNQHTLAVRAGDGYVLNGRKVFVTNGREAAVALVFAQTDPAKAHRGISAFLIERGTPGFLVPKVEDKLGTRGGGRIGIAAQALGIAAGAFDLSVAYAKERKSFGVPIAQHQMVQWMLADMATAIEAARLLIWRAAALKDAGRPFGPEASPAQRV